MIEVDVEDVTTDTIRLFDKDVEVYIYPADDCITVVAAIFEDVVFEVQNYDTKDIEMFISFLKCRYVFEKNIIDEIAKNLIQRYILLYYNLEEKENINREQFNIKKLNLVLETFYS